MNFYQCAVIGGGPAGITAALYLARGGVSTALVESLTVGGQVLSTAEIENYPGFPSGMKGWEFADLLEQHLTPYAIDRLRGEVQKLEKQANGNYLVQFSDGKSLEAATIVLCSGAKYSKLGLADEERLTGKGVSYCAVCDGNFYRGRDVVVIGGGNSALEESLYLARIVNKVYLVHRREGFRGAKVYLDKILAQGNKIEMVTSHIVDRLEGSQNLEAVVVKPVNGGPERRIQAEGVFIFVGMEPSGKFLPPELSKDQRGFVITDVEMATNLPGLFAAGDIRSKHCRQVTAAVGDGATAATSALAYLEQQNV